MASDNKQDIMSLAAQLGRFDGMPSALPPVEQWNPPLSGDMDMVIKADGRWVHEGDEIKRAKLVRLFSTILKKEGAEFFLVTPVEKWRIQVEAAPFILVLTQLEHSSEERQLIRGVTNVGDEVVLNASHSLQLVDGLPQVEVRHGLMAQLGRNVYYELAELSEVRDGHFAVLSEGVWHPLGVVE